MISSKEREMLIAFISKHADGDVLIQAANRVASNMEDMPTLRKFITEYKPPTNAGDYVSQTEETHVITDVDLGFGKPKTVIDKPEDLGPVPKKLGKNGQAIEKLMARYVETEHTVDGLKKSLNIPPTKIKPMLALLIERGRVKRTSNTTYRIVEK